MDCRKCGTPDASEQWYIGARSVPFCRPCWDAAVVETGLEGQPAVLPAFTALLGAVGDEIDGLIRKDTRILAPTARMTMVAERPGVGPAPVAAPMAEVLSAIPLHHCPLCCPDPDTVTTDAAQHERHAMPFNVFVNHVSDCVAAHPERLAVQSGGDTAAYPRPSWLLPGAGILSTIVRWVTRRP